MDRTSSLYRAVRLANALLFIAAVGVALDHSMATALTRLTGEPHWATDGADLVVVDKTGEDAWYQANQHAVAVWNRAAEGTRLHLRWTAGTGACREEPGRIVLCGATSAVLDDDAQLSRQGVAHVVLGDDRGQTHVDRAIVLVCDDCRLGAARRRVVATHELGHALGLAHSIRVGSVMFHTGGPDAPDDLDVGILRTLYRHTDGPDRCGFFDARVGPLCF